MPHIRARRPLRCGAHSAHRDKNRALISFMKDSESLATRFAELTGPMLKC